MELPSPAAAERAKARSTWPIRKCRLGFEPSENLSTSTTPEARLAMMREMAEQAWLLSGREIPDYPRRQMPGRVIRHAR